MPTKTELSTEDRKVLAFRQKEFESRHVIQVGRTVQTSRTTVRWHTIPGLVYRTRKLAQEGLDRLMQHSPYSKLRVRKWRGESVSTLTRHSATAA